MVSHSLASSEYNLRRLQCEEGVKLLKRFLPSVKSLRDVPMNELEKHKSDLPPDIYLRCHYVISENERLLKGCELLKQGNLQGFGQLMYKTHEGLSKEYAVSCEELDFLVQEARPLQGVVGARMMGGGFGGCTINLVKADKIEGFEKVMKTKYQQRFQKDPEIYVTQIEDGARRVPSNQ
jgi:galactokinase